MAQWKRIAILTAILLMGWGGYVPAQPPQSSPPRQGQSTERDPRMEQAIDMMFREMDTDHDGRISKAEWMGFQEKQFKKLDKDGDGFITKDEVRADMTERMKQREQMRNRGAPQ